MHFLINHPELQENIVDTLKVIHFIGNRRMEFFPLTTQVPLMSDVFLILG